MRKVPPHMLALSETLIHETAPAASTTSAAAAMEICKKLRPKLSTLMGFTGFRALLKRALFLAATEVPSLFDLQVDAEGTLVHTQHCPAQHSCDEPANGGVVLVAQLLTLLAAFIGEKLTLQILREIWPHLRADDSNSSPGDK